MKDFRNECSRAKLISISKHWVGKADKILFKKLMTETDITVCSFDTEARIFSIHSFKTIDSFCSVSYSYHLYLSVLVVVFYLSRQTLYKEIAL